MRGELMSHSKHGGMEKVDKHPSGLVPLADALRQPVLSTQDAMVRSIVLLKRFCGEGHEISEGAVEFVPIQGQSDRGQVLSCAYIEQIYHSIPKGLPATPPAIANTLTR